MTRMNTNPIKKLFISQGYDVEDVQILYVHSESKPGMEYDTPQEEIASYLKKYKGLEYFDDTQKHVETADGLFIEIGIRVFYRKIVTVGEDSYTVQ